MSKLLKALSEGWAKRKGHLIIFIDPTDNEKLWQQESYLSKLHNEPSPAVKQQPALEHVGDVKTHYRLPHKRHPDIPV